MKAVVQRVSKASVSIDGELIADINHGLCVFLGIHHDDTDRHSDWMIEKLINCRIFPDDSGVMNYSLYDKNYEILIVSQFTLYGDCSKGRRPNFTQAAPPTIAKPLYNKFKTKLSQKYPHAYFGVFGAKMDVQLINDGPVTLLLER
jgi:D-tyrosyl-tRNA(Tyr) deacylase